jgi:predicted RNase H-like HicB family nuclease
MQTRRSKQTMATSNMSKSSRYPIEVFYSEEDGGFIAIAKDLPGCSAFGKTQAKAVAEIQHAIKAWQEATKAAGNPVPEPSRPVENESLPSGKILLRVPRTLHASLIECAKKESVSLNQHLVSVLSAGVGLTLVREAQRIVASMQDAQRVVTTALEVHGIAGLSIKEGIVGSMQTLFPAGAG